MQISDKVGIIGLVFVALGGGWTLGRSIVSHRRSVVEERCGKCHTDSKRDIDNLEIKITGIRDEYQSAIGRIERDLAGHISTNRDDHKRMHERIDALITIIRGQHEKD